MPEIRVNGLALHYEERGEGAPIVGIHGGGSTAMLWAEALDELGRLGRAIVYDRRGCARSERPTGYTSTTVAEQADDAAALIDALGASPAVVIGRSFGGAIAVDLALRYRDRVRALVLLEGDALGLSPAGRTWTEELRDHLNRVAAEQGVDAIYPALIERVAGAGAWESFPEQVRRTLAGNGPALLAELHYLEEPMPDAAAFATIDVPTLLVAASDSIPEQRQMTEAMAAAIPGAHLSLVGGGHLIDPATPEVLAFIEDVLRT